MREWLALAAAAPLLIAPAANGQIRGLRPADIADIARSRALDFRLSQMDGEDRPAPFISTQILRRGLGSGAFVGLGLGNSYGKTRAGSNLRPGEQPRHSRKPSVTFVVKF